jgi:IS5 family transposase
MVVMQFSHEHGRAVVFSRDRFERHSKTTRRTKFLLEMDRIVPWKRLRKIVRPFCYKGEGVGRQPIELERMLRMYFLQHCST